MNATEQMEIAKLVVGLTSQLLGVIVTLIALIPTVIALARVKAPDVFSRKDGESAVHSLMLFLIVDLVTCLLSLVLACLCVVYSNSVLLWVSAGGSVVTIILLGIAGLYTAMNTRKAM